MLQSNVSITNLILEVCIARIWLECLPFIFRMFFPRFFFVGSSILIVVVMVSFFPSDDGPVWRARACACVCNAGAQNRIRFYRIDDAFCIRFDNSIVFGADMVLFE